MPKISLPLPLALFCLAGLVAPSAAGAAVARYQCADGTKLSATFTGGMTTLGSAVLDFDKPVGRITLPQQMSADGGRYTDDTTQFWIKGKGATLTRAGKPDTECTTR